MKIKLIITNTLLFCLIFFKVNSQITSLPDSIKLKIDTMRPKSVNDYLIKKTWKIINTDPTGAMVFAKAHYEKGVLFKDTLLIANALVSKGTIYQMVADFPKSLNDLIKAIKLYTLINDSSRLATSYNNIGNTYLASNDFANAALNMQKSLNLRIQIKDSSRVSTTYLNLGNISLESGDFLSAKKYYFKGFHYTRLKRSSKLAFYASLSILNTRLNKFDSAFYYINKHKEIAIDTFELANYYLILGGIYLTKKDYHNAEHNLLMANKLFKVVGEESLVIKLNNSFYKLYKEKGNNKLALEYFEKISILKDSANNKLKTLQVAFLNTEFNVNQKEAEIINLKQKALIDEKEKARIKLVRNFVIGGILFVVIFIIVLFLKSKERKKLLSQLNTKNTEITDSINYAKYIQNSFLPSPEKLNRNFKDYFIFYQPKDIIAGDFYWMEETKDNVWFAVADCTGHGVPGALVSVVCCNALNRAIGEFNLIQPGEILDKAREIIIKRFSSNSSSIKDGMDITIIRFDKKKTNANVTIEYAGANNALYKLTNGKLIKLMVDKQPVGFIESFSLFTTHKITLDSADTLYMFTDGYCDQFGGPKKKKFKTKQLLGLLEDISTKGFDEQKLALEKTFTKWKSNVEQIDDVCIVGFKCI